jgi:hypothetical protein
MRAGFARAQPLTVEDGEMNKQWLIALALVLCAGIGVMGISSRGWQRASNVKQADAAYRDGSFQAKIDVESGRKPHFSSGRWNTDQDRASFIAGYEQTYRELAETRTPKLTEPTPAELSGFRDGIVDGARDRKAAQPFQVSKTDNYRKMDRESPEVNSAPETYRHYYREAYSNGYQEGYYSQQEGVDLRTISKKSSPF